MAELALRAAKKSNRELVGTFDLLRHCFQLIHIPMYPKNFPLRKRPSEQAQFTKCVGSSTVWVSLIISKILVSLTGIKPINMGIWILI
jgi:hypothetical protein